ncbi:Abi family protein [Staphylococcus epidermidis]
MKKLGIRFNIDNEKVAKDSLSKYSYFFKLGYFRKNFPKVNGRYNIEFAYLKDLASIDMQLRYLLIHMCLDIEHSLKVYILDKVANDPCEDGYNIMTQFYKNDSEKNRTFRNVISKKKKNSSGKYSTVVTPKKEFKNYYNNPPIWVCLELMSYNQFVEFVIFYQTHTNDNQLKCAKNLLSHVKTVRNMSAHSQPIIANLGTPKFDKTNRYLTDKGQTSYKLTYKQVQYKPLRDIFATFYTHQLYCSKGIRENRYKQMVDFKMRLNRNSYYSSYTNLSVVINGINKMIDNYKND